MEDYGGLEDLAKHLYENKTSFVMVTFGLKLEDSTAFIAATETLVELGLKGVICYSPLLDDGKSLFVKKKSGEYLP